MATKLLAFSDTRIESEEGGRGLRVTHTSEESTMPLILGHSAAIHRVLNHVQLVARRPRKIWALNARSDYNRRAPQL